MEGDSGLGLRKWSFYEQQPLKGSLGLQLTSSVLDRDSKSFSGGQAIHGNFLQSNCRIPESSTPMEFMRDGWMHQRDKLLHALQGNPHLVPLSEPSAASNPLQISQPQTSEIPKPENDVRIENVSDRKKTLKKRSEDSIHKSPKPKKGKKAETQKMGKNSYFSQIKPVKSTGFVINGVNIDITGIPIPVCTCTGSPQQCYKWGCGGWQSACCTTSISMYPLPMSTKRKGARIAGRKMSQGAFKKVMEKLAAEGYNFSSPIDLKTHWAKHGTNKFVTIR